MKGVALLLGVLLLLGGGAVAGAQFVPGLDLSSLSSIGGAGEFLASKNALYAGAGAAGFGLVMLIVGVLPKGSKKTAPRPEIGEITPPPSAVRSEPPRPAPRPVETPKPAPQPIQPKPVASAKPPASATQPAKAATVAEADAPTWTQDPRLTNRKRVSDLVTINDALKAYHSRHGKYPIAEKLGGYLDRGRDWIPGLAPDFLRELPRDPALSNDRSGPQYLYVSNGLDYKLVAQGVSLVGGTNVEVLGVKFDPSKNNTMEKAAFGFWTEKFTQV